MTRQRDKGFVLVAVLWILAILTVISLGFQRRAMLEAKSSRYALDHNTALLYARGAVERGVLELRNMSQLNYLDNTEGGITLNQRIFDGEDLYAAGIYYTLPEGVAQADDCRYIVEDMERYININAAPQEMLEEIENLDRSAIRRINARITGEEEEDGKRKPFHSIEELRFIEGIDDDNWFGDGNDPGLRDLFTTYGSGRININTASADVLSSIPEFDDDIVEAIIAARQRIGGFESLEDAANKARISGDANVMLQRHCAVHSSYFRITGFATLHEGRVRASCSAVVHGGDGGVSILDWQEDPLGA